MDIENKNTQTAENQETEQETNVDATENQETEQQQEEKTFTQAELDKQIGERLKRERSKMPHKEDLEAFKEWKKSQQTEQEKIAEERKQADKIRTELQQLKNERAVLKSGVNSDYADFISFKVSQMEGDFQDNLEGFLKDNPQFSKTPSQGTTIPAGGQKIKNEAGKPDYSQLSDSEYYKMMKEKNKI